MPTFNMLSAAIILRKKSKKRYDYMVSADVAKKCYIGM